MDLTISLLLTQPWCHRDIKKIKIQIVRYKSDLNYLSLGPTISDWSGLANTDDLRGESLGGWEVTKVTRGDLGVNRGG